MASKKYQQLAIAARQILVSKRALQRSLPRGLVNDPAVDILLSLFVHDVDRVVMTDTELGAIVDCASPSAFNRWLLALEAEQLTQRRVAPDDEFFVELTDHGRMRVADALMKAAGAERGVRSDPLQGYQAP